MPTRKDAMHAAFKIFGPRVELVRVSSNDRSERFKVALGSFVINPSDRPTPLLLGTGDSWESAIDHARTTENGKLAEKTNLEALDLVRKAMASKSELEFANIVEDDTLKEAASRGANEAEIAAIKHKFTQARKKINAHVAAGPEAKQPVNADPSDRIGDGGPGGEDQQERKPNVAVQGSGGSGERNSGHVVEHHHDGHS